MLSVWVIGEVLLSQSFEVAAGFFIVVVGRVGLLSLCNNNDNDNNNNNLICTIVPVIIAATGTVTRSLKKNLETIPGKHSIDSLQKTAILGTSHIIRKVLQCEA